MLGSVRAAAVIGGSQAHLALRMAASFTLSTDMEVTGCTLFTTPFDGGIPVGTRIGVAPNLLGSTTIPWLGSGLSTTNPGSGVHPVTVEFESPVTLLAGVTYCITGDCDLVCSSAPTNSGVLATNANVLTRSSSSAAFAVDGTTYKMPFELYGFAPPGTAVSDAYARADNPSVLGVADTGQTWEVLNGTAGIIGGKAYFSSSGTQSYAVIDSTLHDCSISVTLDGTLSSGGGITFRASDATHLWFTECDSGTSYLYRNNGGGPVLIDTIGVSWSPGDVQTVQLRANTITVKKNGVDVYSRTDSTFATNTKHGIRDYGGAARFSSFSVTEVPPVTGSAPVAVSSSSVARTVTPTRVTGTAPATSASSSTARTGSRTTGDSPVNVSASGYILVDLEPLSEEDGAVQILVELTGVMDPEHPAPVPPVDFEGLLDPTVAPVAVASTTSDGHLPAGTYRYSYAAWKGSYAQATAPSPTVDVTLTTENTVTLTYPTIDGADGYLVYREDV